MATKQEKEPPNVVHQNAILCETIRKEQRSQKLNTNYSCNPFKKLHVVSDKPNSICADAGGQRDEKFLTMYKNAQEVPNAKFDYPQTEAQEYGWLTQPLIEGPRNDSRLHHPKNHSEITKYMDAYWRQKEQESLHQ